MTLIDTTPLGVGFVRFNVRGQVFITKKENILKFPDSLLAKLIEHDENGDIQIDKIDDAIFIDSDPKYFNVLLDIYRDGATSTTAVCKLDFDELLYYGMVYNNLKEEFVSKQFVMWSGNVHAYFDYDKQQFEILRESNVKTLYFVPSLISYTTTTRYGGDTHTLLINNCGWYGRFFSTDSLHKYYPFLAKIDLDKLFSNICEIDGVTIYWVSTNDTVINSFLSTKIVELVALHPEHKEIYMR
jgi:hypothetical protein